jgi:hypothetical protein
VVGLGGKEVLEEAATCIGRSLRADKPRMKRNHIFEMYSEGTVQQRPDYLDEAAKRVSLADLPRMANKSDLELSWREFVAWIGFSELSKALTRKAASIDQTSLRLLSENIFSIEIGLIEVSEG